MHISSNSSRGHIDHKQLLCQLGLWFAYYCDKMIGHAKDMASSMRYESKQGNILNMHKGMRGKWDFIDMMNGGLLALLTRFSLGFFNEGGSLLFWVHLYSTKTS